MRWQPIETLNRTEMQFVLVSQDGAVRLHLWNPRGYWERSYPYGSIVGEGDCQNPTHWMPCPDAPIEGELQGEARADGKTIGWAENTYQGGKAAADRVQKPLRDALQERFGPKPEPVDLGPLWEALALVFHFHDLDPIVQAKCGEAIHSLERKVNK